MAEAKTGDKVRVHYTGTLEDGTTFDSSEGRDPLEFTLGENQVIPGFEQAVCGLNVGEEKSVTIPPEEAYGMPNPEMQTTLSKSQLPEGLEPEVGMMLQANAPDGSALSVKITGVDDDTISVDANHPLAGKTLTFAISLVEIL